MSNDRRRRRHSPAVYRRRRLLLLILVLAIAAAIAWLLIAQPWQAWAAARSAAAPKQSASVSLTPSATPDEAPSTSPSTTPTPSATPSGTPSPTATVAETGTAKPCVTRAITVEPVTDASTYGAGQNPQLSIRLTNTGGLDCTLNVGTSTQAFTITSGNDTWWRSTDCQTEPSDMIVTLAAGQTVASAVPVVWDRTRSSVSTCGDANRPVAPGGGASYHLDVEVGGIVSNQSAQFILR
ncbi:hypothetical protein [Microbacterium sp. P5_E9]